MTAQIAILNKTAIALASDSAVTIGREKTRKTYNTVNKLFTLSKYAPVGIMFYGNAEFMGIPWETILKIYREALSQQTFPTISEYAKHFLTFLESSKDLFPADQQERAFDAKVASNMTSIRKELDQQISQLFEAGQQVNDTVIQQVFSGLIAQHCNYLRKLQYLPNMTKAAAKKLAAAYRKRVEHLAAEVFQKLPRSMHDTARLCAIARSLVAKDVFAGVSSGVVIAGFGDDEHFPVLVSFNVDCIIDGKLRSKPDRKAEINHRNSAQITPFAQADMVSEFMEGVHPSFVSFFEQRLTETFRGLPDQIVKCVGNDAVDDDCKKRLSEFFEQLLKDLNVDQNRFRRNQHINPVIDAVAVLPKEELAIMATALVNLTQFRQKITLQAETVGGPIDVAVISKGDGFIWINRKHYFDPKFNPHFFHNYFHGSIDGGEA